jgi:hypothetical protein
LKRRLKGSNSRQQRFNTLYKTYYYLFKPSHFKMVANNNNNAAAAGPIIAPAENPFLADGAMERYDQLFQLYLMRGAEPNEENDIYLFGFYDTDQQEVVVQLGRGADPRYGRATEQMTLSQLLWDVMQVEHEYRFTEAVWAGWGDKEAAPAFILNNPAAILNFRLADLHQEGLAASFDLHIDQQPDVQA